MYVDKYDWLVQLGLVKSKSEARRMVKQGGVRVDNEKIIPETQVWFDPYHWHIQWEIDFIKGLRELDSATRKLVVIQNLENPEFDIYMRETILKDLEDIENGEHDPAASTGNLGPNSGPSYDEQSN